MKLTLTKNYLDGELDAADLQFEMPCPGITGQNICLLGKMPSGAVCPLCKGRGIVVTPLGMHILSFVIKNAKAYREGKLL